MAFKKNSGKRERRERSDRGMDQTIRKRTRYLDPTTVVDSNDIELLRRFVTEYGKIIPARITGVTMMQQREIKRGVRRARNMGLLA
jgi:small subunit ribosomal protein S18